jgi:hypothetical protein
VVSFPWWDNITKMDIRKIGWCGYWLDSSDSGYERVSSCCEQGNEPSGSVACWENFEWLSYCWLLKKDSAPWSSLVRIVNYCLCKSKIGGSQQGSPWLLVTCCFANLTLRHWRWSRYVPPKLRLTFTGLHGVIAQKIQLLITTVLRTSNTVTSSVYFRTSHNWNRLDSFSTYL